MKSFLKTVLFIFKLLFCLFIIIYISKYQEKCIFMKCSNVNEYHDAPYPINYLNISDPNLYHEIINPKLKKTAVDFIISIPVAPYDTDFRKAIRTTWLFNYSQLLSFFFMGVSNCTDYCAIKKESLLYNDIIQFNFINSYLNLTLLTILSICWVVNSNIKFKYYLKIDRDVVPNLKNIFDLITIKYKNIKGVFGPKSGDFEVTRNVNSRSFIPYFVYSKRIAPAYITGMIYIIDYISLLTINNISMKFKPIIYREDVHLGLLCRIEGIKLINIKNIILKKTYNYSQYCKYYSFDLYKPKDMYKLFSNRHICY